MANIAYNPKFWTHDESGGLANGYLLFTYEPGTSTKKATYSDKALTTPNTNPIVLDSRGEADVFLDGSYKFVLAIDTADDPPSGGDTVWTVDNYEGAASDAVIVSIVNNVASLGTGSIDGEMAIDKATGNLYTWDDGNSKWRVMPGNYYTTANLPSFATYTAEVGTVVFDTTTSKQQYSDGTQWVTIKGTSILQVQVFS